MLETILYWMALVLFLSLTVTDPAPKMTKHDYAQGFSEWLDDYWYHDFELEFDSG